MKRNNCRDPISEIINKNWLYNLQVYPVMMNGVFVFWILLVFSTSLLNSMTESCNKHCSWCEDNYCSECYYGYWGHNCHKQCQNCWLAGCKKNSGRCIQCQPGRHGEHCDLPCSVKCRLSRSEGIAHCKRDTGKCLEGCVKGWWGTHCQHKCSSGCQEVCYQEDGACLLDCKKGFYGTHCNKTCSEGCALGTCDWLMGTCHGGCKCGYSGETCQDECSKNCHSPCKHDMEMDCLTCNVSCGPNCKLCDRLRDVCLQCMHGLYGRLCNHACSDNCIGHKCDIDGNCVEGCKDEYYGDKCMEKCPNNCKSCNTRSRTCQLCKQEMPCSSVPNTQPPNDGDVSINTNPTNGAGYKSHPWKGNRIMQGFLFTVIWHNIT